MAGNAYAASMTDATYVTAEDAQIDRGIRGVVDLLVHFGVETFESCEGGSGHAFHEPTVRFHGAREQGFRALAVAQQHGLSVTDLRRYWAVIDGEPTGPHWEMVFAPSAVGFSSPY